MAAVVTVRHTVVANDLGEDVLIFDIEEGLDEVKKLRGPDFKGSTFKIRAADASAGPDAPSTIYAACRQLGGDQWRARLTWQVVDERGGLITEHLAFSERAGAFDHFVEDLAEAFDLMVAGQYNRIYVPEADAATFQPPPGWIWLSDAHVRNDKRWALYGPPPAEIP